jgi:large subunit ribosomal protein L5
MMVKVEAETNVMRSIKIGKIVLNIGVGKSGEALERAKKVVQDIVGSIPSIRKSRKTIRDFGIHKDEPIGVTVTLRGVRAFEVLKRLLAAKDMRLAQTSFDERGNCSFGIKEHIDIPGIKYDPDIGIFGMDVSVISERPGFRVMRRRRVASRIGRKHRVTRNEAIKFFKDSLGVEVSEV